MKPARHDWFELRPGLWACYRCETRKRVHRVTTRRVAGVTTRTEYQATQATPWGPKAGPCAGASASKTDGAR